ncbi:MAG TPA: CoA transferase, partial [Solimonas sp.]|nr:CoA transferase [Solimonas sp.]
GARQGPPAFYDRLNHGKRSVALDPRTPAGHARWQALFAAADIVIEASRPRALRQLGFEPEALVRAQGLTWISLSGYGREEPQAQWVAYGDDAGVAGGLSARLRQQTGERLFVGDAIADPLTGLHAALAAWQGWQAGGGELVALALRDVIAQLVHFDWPAAPPLPVAAALPLPDPAPAAARPLGADTAAVLLEWTGAC